MYLLKHKIKIDRRFIIDLKCFKISFFQTFGLFFLSNFNSTRLNLQINFSFKKKRMKNKNYVFKDHKNPVLFSYTHSFLKNKNQFRLTKKNNSSKQQKKIKKMKTNKKNVMHKYYLRIKLI